MGETIENMISKLDNMIAELDSESLDLNSAVSLYEKTLKHSQNTVSALKKTNDKLQILEEEQSQLLSQLPQQ